MNRSPLIATAPRKRKTTRETWKQVLAFVVAMGAISHLTTTLVDFHGDVKPAVKLCGDHR